VIVTVNLIIFFSYFAISVTVTVNLNNTDTDSTWSERHRNVVGWTFYVEQGTTSV